MDEEKDLLQKVSEQVDVFVEELSRTEIMKKSLDNYGYILVADTMEDVIDIANEIASEHLEIMTKNPPLTLKKLQQAELSIGTLNPAVA